MVNSPNVDLVSWSNGDSFVIVDVEKFSQTVLPKYFKHSKFTSFVRQLNFYGFRKIRSDHHESNTLGVASHDGDDDSSNDGSTKKVTSVRFYHEFFQANRPELLYRIQRATRSAEPPTLSQIDHLSELIKTMKERMDSMESQFEAKLVKMRTAMDADYQRRFVALESSYKELLAITVRERYSAGQVAPIPAATRDRYLAMAAAQDNFALEQRMLSTLGRNNILTNTSPSAGDALQYLNRNPGLTNTSPSAGDALQYLNRLPGAGGAMDWGNLGRFGR